MTQKSFGQYLLDLVIHPALALGIFIGTLITNIIWLINK